MGNKQTTRQMKLYTEEQSRKMFFEGIKYAASITPASMDFVEQYVDKKMNTLTPIELPSDEEIENADFHLKGKSINFINGAKWVIEQIKQQDNVR